MGVVAPGEKKRPIVFSMSTLLSGIQFLTSKLYAGVINLMSVRGQQPSGMSKRSSGIDDGDRNNPRNIGTPTAQPSYEAASPRTFYRAQVT